MKAQRVTPPASGRAGFQTLGEGDAQRLVALTCDEYAETGRGQVALFFPTCLQPGDWGESSLSRLCLFTCSSANLCITCGPNTQVLGA